MATEGQPVQAGVYCRISRADIDDKTKVDDQERICRNVARAHGWTVAEVYKDNNKSAWKHNRKRPGWDQMLKDVEAGKITAIVVYNGDRLTRQPMDLETLFSLSRTRGIQLASPGGVKDLNNDDDQFVLGIEANVWRRESASTSRRKKAQYDRWRLEGRAKPGGHGGRCFGFATDGLTHMPPDRCDIATRREISEADIIRRAAAAVLAGQSLGMVVRDLTAAGVTSTAGRPLTVKALQRILTYPRMAGLMPDGVSRAAWDEVLPRQDWEALCALIAMNTPLPNAGRGAQHLLSGIARCGADGCGRPLWSGHNAGGPAYRCAACGRVGRSMKLLDAYVTARVVGRLNHPDNPAGRIPETPGLAAEFASLTEALAEIDEVLADHTRGSVPALLARRDGIKKRLAELRDLAGDDARSRLLTKHAGISYDEFLSLPLPVQRSLVAACFEVVVLPASARGPGFRTEDVRLTPR